MLRKTIVFLLVGSAAGAALFAWMWLRVAAPRPIQVVGVLNHAPITEASFAGFKAGMSALGRAEGKDVRYLYAGTRTDSQALLDEARNLVEQKVDAILALSTLAAKIAQEAAAGTSIPVVFAAISDPLATGLIETVRRPGRNITGIAFGRQEPRRLEWLVRLAPGMKRIYYPYSLNDPAPKAQLRALAAVSRKLGVELVPREISSPADVEAALTDIPPDVDAAFLPVDALLASRTDLLARAARARRLPLSVPHRDGLHAGALVSFGTDLYDSGHQSAHLVDQILRGVPASELPVEVPEFLLSLNLATARAIGLEIPEDILRQAILLGDET